MDFNAIMNSKEYDFLRNNKRLGNRIILLGLGGSYAYGTDNGNSDIDFRGITLNLPSDILGLTSFEQYTDEHTDTVIYAFNKIVKLLLECNPNTIEILGLDEEQYLIKTDLGQELIHHTDLFLSKRAAKSFGGYNALDDFNRKNQFTDGGRLKLYIDNSDNPEFQTEIFVDAEYKHIPLRDYNNMMNTMYNVIREYDKLGKRNRKKDDNHLNKHAMHLIRLFLMALDILNEGKIVTHRIKDLELLRSIRRGDYQKEDGTYKQEFYEMLTDYEEQLKIATERSELPDNPDMDKVEAFVERINGYAIKL